MLTLTAFQDIAVEVVPSASTSCGSYFSSLCCRFNCVDRYRILPDLSERPFMSWSRLSDRFGSIYNSHCSRGWRILWNLRPDTLGQVPQALRSRLGSDPDGRNRGSERYRTFLRDQLDRSGCTLGYVHHRIFAPRGGVLRMEGA